MISGQADKVFIKTDEETGERYVYIDDYKTNKKIKKSNYFQKMLPPLSHLDDCHYNHYRMQISTYAWMLEQFGFIIKGTAFTHFNNMYDFEYRKTDVQKVVDKFKTDNFEL